MKKLVFTFFMLLVTTMLMGKETYYTVDGKLGVRKIVLSPA